MGASLVTVPYENETKPNLNQQEASSSTQSQSQTKSNSHFNHHIASVNLDDVPSGCPMHQAKEKKTLNAPPPDHTKTLVKNTSSSGCPIGNNPNEINPNNMVCFVISC